MVGNVTQVAVTTTELREGRGSRWLLRMARRKPLAAASAVMLGVALLTAVTAPWVSPSDPTAPSRDRLQPPSRAHLMGTDELGRDVASRIIWGARTSMITGLVVSLVATAAGLLLGGLSGFLGGAFDTTVQRVVDAVQSLPPLIVAMVLVTMVGRVVWQDIPLTVVIALSIVLISGAARVARGAALGVKVQPFVEASRAIGGSTSHIFVRHVVPNIVSPMLIIATVQLGGVILAEASLSFLGVGTPPPTPSWGAMVSGSGRAYLQQAPWIVLSPGICITLAVLAFNFLGDGVRDLLDPRLRQR